MSLLDTASLIVTPNGYKEGKLYSVIPSDGSGDLSVTRATTATRVNSAGLVELVPYNLISYSESPVTSPWQSYGVIMTANAATAPDGTNTATRVQIPSGGSYYLYQGVPFSSGAKTISCYIKGATAQTIGFNDGNFNPNSINITTEWQRYTFTFNSITSMGIQFDNYYGVSPSQQAKDFYIWGAQLVEGSTAKDYQKTETRLNIPRLDYSNGTCPSLLVEPQRTNLALYSSSFSNVAWTSSSGTTLTSNYGIAPNGLMQSTRIQWSSNQQFLYQIIASAGQEASTIYIKGIAGETIKFGRDNTVANGTLFTLDGTWQRLELSTNNGGVVFFLSTFNAGNATDFEIWGAQLEAGSYSTSYIPTTSASVTRNADVISKTGISSLIGQTEGTIFVEANVQSGYDGNNVFITLSDGTSSNIMYLNRTDGKAEIYIELLGLTQVSYVMPTILSSGVHKLAVGYKANDFVFYIDGVLVHSDTSGNVPLMSKINIGSYFNNGITYNDGIKAAALWKTRLTNDQLATLTTL